MQHVGRLGVLPRRARRRLRPQVRAAVGLDRGGVQLRLLPGQFCRQSKFRDGLTGQHHVATSRNLESRLLTILRFLYMINDELLKHPCSVAFANGTSQDALDENRGFF